MAIFDFLFGTGDKKKKPEASAPLPVAGSGAGSSVLTKPTATIPGLTPAAPQKPQQSFDQIRKESTIEPVRRKLSEERLQSVTPETAIDFIEKNPKTVDEYFSQFGFSGMKEKQDQKKKLDAVQRVLNISLDTREDPVSGKVAPTEEATEFLKNEFYNLRAKEAQRSAFGEGVGAFASDIASTLDFVAGGRKGTFNTTNLGKADMILDFLGDAAPDEAALLAATQFEGESPLARGAGQLAGILATSFVPGGAATKALKALPIISRLKNGTKTARLTAVVMENVAFDMAASGFFNLRDDREIEEWAKNIAASPSVLLPYHKKWNLVAAPFADYLAGRAVGMDDSEALFNATIGLGAGIMQRSQTLNEVGIRSLRRRAAEEAEKIRQVVAATNPKSSTVIRMQDDAVRLLEKEARMLGFKPKEGSSLFKENRMLGFADNLPGGQNIPDDIDDVPLSEFSPQGRADADAGQKILDAGGTPEQAAKARADAVPQESLTEILQRQGKNTPESGVSPRPESPPALRQQSLTTRADSTTTDPSLSIDRDPNSIIEPVPRHNIDEAQELMREVFPIKGRSDVTKDIAKSKRTAKGGIKDIIGNPEKVRTQSEVQGIVIKDQVEKLTDIRTVSTRFTDVFNNTKKVFGEAYPRVKRTLLDPFDQSKGQRVDFLNERKQLLKENVTDNFGFKRKSKESAAIQKYGENPDKRAAYRELIEDFGSKKADQIVQADKFFRQQYDDLIDRVNAVRKTIYPDKPPIPKLENYYRHFQEISSTVSGIRNAIDSPNNIEPALEGISAFTQPRSRYLSFGQKRKGDVTELDAISGYLQYLDSAAYAIHIDQHINRFRAFRQVLAETTENSKNINNYIRFLDEFANDLAGKTNPFDREVQNIVGRRVMRVADLISRRTRENSVLGNISSAVSQVFNIPQSIAEAGIPNSIRGMQLTMAQIFDQGDAAIRKSAFLKERYAKSHYGGFEVGMLENAKKMAGWITQVGDEVGTKYIWNSMYAKALNDNIPNPIKYADDQARAMVAGRGVGEVPLIQKSRFFKMIAPFQLEVTNAARITKNMVAEREFKKLGTLLVANFVMNRIAEEIRGSPVVYDPIQALIDSINNDNSDEGAIERVTKIVGRQAGEVFSNLPLGQTLASGITNADPRLSRELFGEGDPTRFGSNIMFRPATSVLRALVQPTPRNISDAIKDPIFTLITPFGGQQLKKTLEGIGAVSDGEVKDRKGKKMFDVEDDPVDQIQSILFGKYSTDEARTYFNTKQGQADRNIIELLFGEEGARSTSTRRSKSTRRGSSSRRTESTRR